MIPERIGPMLIFPAPLREISVLMDAGISYAARLSQSGSKKHPADRRVAPDKRLADAADNRDARLSRSEAPSVETRKAVKQLRGEQSAPSLLEASLLDLEVRAVARVRGEEQPDTDLR
jgi:hypothetical protein